MYNKTCGKSGDRAIQIVSAMVILITEKLSMLSTLVYGLSVVRRFFSLLQSVRIELIETTAPWMSQGVVDESKRKS